jgi:ATP-dependent Clp protease protease subunit
MRQKMAELIAHHSGRPIEAVITDIDRDHFMTPEEAIDYGLIDEVVSSRELRDGDRKA